jgi:hypothetical protein
MGGKGKKIKKIIEGTYAIRGYGWNGAAWVDGAKKGRMRYVGMG